MHPHEEVLERLARVLSAKRCPNELHPQRMSQMRPCALLRGAFEPIGCTSEGSLQSHRSSLIVHDLLGHLEEEVAISTEATDRLEHHEVQCQRAKPMLFELQKYLPNLRGYLPLR